MKYIGYYVIGCFTFIGFMTCLKYVKGVDNNV